MSNIIKILEEDLKKKVGKYYARSYYDYKPKQIQNEVNVYSDDHKIHTVKNNNGNCFLYTNYFKLLVNQKLNYLLAKDPEIKISNSDITVTSIVDMLEEGLLNASLDTTAWLHFYVDNNKLDWIFVHDSEIIPIYDKYKKNIIEVIRYFSIDKDTYKVETWSKNGVKVEVIAKDKIQSSEILHHYEETTYYQGKIESVEGKNLPFIPFIPLFNNRSKTPDIDGIKELIDMYNSINSGFVDNINLFQEAIVKLKGFTADTEQLETISKNMRKYKIVGLPNGGGDNVDMDYMSIEIPVEARKVILELLKENIFKIGQGLDPDRLAGESNVTNVVIKSRYSQLDMKANGSEKQLKLFYEKFVDCWNSFNNSNVDKNITFNRSMIFNESEAIDNCLKSINMLPMELILENHPFVKGDAKKVLNNFEKEKEENMKRQQDLMKKEENDTNKMTTNDLK